MKNKKRIVSLSMAATMLMGAAAYAAPTHIVIDDKAYDINELGEEAYKAAFDADLKDGGENKIYIADDEGKTVSVLDFITGNYAEDFEAAPNKANDLGPVKLVNPDLTEGAEVVLPGTDVVEELAVESVSAINKSTVEVTFNNEVSAEDALTFEINGVSSTATLEGKVASVAAVPNLVDEEDYTVKVYADGELLKEESFKFDLAEPTTLSALVTTQSATVGSSVVYEFKLVDEDGDALAGEEVFVRSTFTRDGVGFPDQETQTVTTDENGIAKATFSQSELGIEEVQAYVVSKPTVRSAVSTTDWNLNTEGSVSVTERTATTIGTQTYYEYNVEAKKTDGTAYTGNLLFDLNVETTTDNTLGAGDVTVERWNGTTWVTVAVNGALEIDPAAGTDKDADYVYKLTSADAGKAKFRVVSNKAAKIAPTFFYDLESTGDETLDNDEPRAIGSTLTYVAQEAKLTLEELDSAKDIALGSAKEYKLTAVDQFGNPFRGVVELEALENVDQLASTNVPTGATVTIEADTDLDETYELTGQTDIDFSIGGDDMDNDGIANVSFESDIAGTITPVAFVDGTTGTAGLIDSGEAKAVAEAIKFVGAPTAIKIAPETGAAELAENGNKTFVVDFLDSKGEAVTPTNDILIQVLDADGNLVDPSGTTGAITVELDVDGNTFADGAINTDSDGWLIASTAFNNETSILVNFASDTAGDYTIRVAGDQNGNEDFEADEVSTSIAVNVSASKIAQGELSAAETAGGDTVVTEFADGGTTNVASETVGGGDVTYTYTIQDQSGNAYNPNGVNVRWNVTNNSDEDITVAGTTLTPGKSTSVTNPVAGATTTDTLAIVATDAGDVAVSAEVVGVATSKVTSTLTYYTTAEELGTGEVFEGTVAAILKDADVSGDGADDADGTILVINTAIGKVFASAASTDAYKVGVNTATEKSFENALAIGKTVKVSDDGTTLTFELK